MSIVTVFCDQFSDHSKFEFAISDLYAKLCVLKSLARYFGALFVTCDKFGCRQFLPVVSDIYPIRSYQCTFYKKNLPYLEPIFGSTSTFSPLIFTYYE